MSPLRIAYLVLPAVAALTLTFAGCAVQGPAGSGDFVPRSEPAARMALRPEYKVFYDALADYGDWDLIEPYGYVFRPKVDPLIWRPYSYGYWAPTDAYGWVWMSSDDFGWATDHYGRWFYDSYKGWVWMPGIEWAPAWVTWQMNDQYAGWAPMGPNGYDMYGARIPGGPFLFATLPQLATTDVHTQAVTLDKVPPVARGTLKPVSDVIERDGVKLAPGLAVGRVEHATGFTIGRVRLDDAVTISTPQDQGRHSPSLGGAAPPSSRHDSPQIDPDARTGIEAIRRAATRAAQSAQQLSERPVTLPALLPVVRPFGVPGSKPASAPVPGRPRADRAAAPDTTR